MSGGPVNGGPVNGFPEEELRRALHALADRPAVPVPTPHAVVRQARARRHRRVAGAGLADRKSVV